MIYINFYLLFFLCIYIHISALVYTYRDFELKLQNDGYDSSIIRGKNTIVSNSL